MGKRTTINEIASVEMCDGGNLLFVTCGLHLFCRDEFGVPVLKLNVAAYDFYLKDGPVFCPMAPQAAVFAHSVPAEGAAQKSGDVVEWPDIHDCELQELGTGIAILLDRRFIYIKHR